MSTVCGFGILLVCLISVLAVESGCKYKAKVTKAAPCSSNKDPVVALENFDLALSDENCGLQIKGCIKVMKDIKTLEVKYKGMKDGLPVVSGAKQGCGFKEKSFEVKCPLNKGQKLCPGGSNIAIPGGEKSLGMAVGKLKATVDVVADGKKYCYEGMGEILPK